jgi:tau tubulin kinase
MALRKPNIVTNEKDDELFQEGDIIDDKYKIFKNIGRGGYGEIYACKTLKTSEAVAVKVERVCKPGNLAEEESILRDLKGCKYVPHLLNSGRHEDRVNYIVMDLLGENLSVLRRKQASHHFSLLCTLMLGMQMLRAIKEVHETGYIHRDIKPGNFVMGTERTGNVRTVIMIDYGLAKRHLYEDGTVRPKRKISRWVGSRRYMSLNTHLRKEQGRRDDLWSLLYVLLEFLTGTLPWAHLRGIDNLDKVRDMKQQYNNEKLVRGLPEEFMKFMNHIKSLKYDSRPDYELLHGLLKSLFERNGGKKTTAFDWESPDQISSSIPSTDGNEDGSMNENAKQPMEDEFSDASTTTTSSSSTSSKEKISKLQNEDPNNGADSSGSDKKSSKTKCTII